MRNEPANPLPYMPVIKWQQYEKIALENVASNIIHRINPCIEIRSTKQHHDILSSLTSVWKSRFYIDYSNPDGVLTPSRLSEFFQFINAFYSLGLAVPTLSPNDFSTLNSASKQLMSKCKNIAFRLRLSDFAITSQNITLLTRQLTEAKLLSLSVELIIDLRTTPKNITQTSLSSFCTSLIVVSKIGFTSIKVLSGSFPGSIATVGTGTGNFPRDDWKLWEKIKNNTVGLNVGYADYGVLSPEWTEKTLTRRGSRVAIRYTRDNDWLVLRAAGNKSSDSIALSMIMTSSFKADFKGKNYSFGDKLIDDKANASVPANKKKCGHYQFTEAWSHHMAFVVKEQY